MTASTAHRVISLLVLLALLIQPLSVTAAYPAAAAAAPTVQAAHQVDPQKPGFLFRATVTLAGSRNVARLEKTGVLVLRTVEGDGAQSALVLADGEQLADLARLGFKPRAADELRLLVASQGREKQWLAKSLAPLLAEADAAAELRAIAEQQGAAEVAGAAGAAATPDALALQALRTSVRALTPEQIAGTADSASVDDDADGLTNTQEQWWCTDPLDADTDDDGRTDGFEIQMFKDWLENKRDSAPGETPWPSWPFNQTTCPDKDHDSIPNLAEQWELGLNMDWESSDRDKFDDGQELFGVTYCPGGDLSCGYGDLPRSADSGYVGAQMPAWVKAPGNHPAVAAFPVPEVNVVESSLHVQTVTIVTTDHVIGNGTEKSYSTATTDGTSTSDAETVTWNEWQEVSEALQQPILPISANSAVPPFPVPVPTPTPDPNSDLLKGTGQPQTQQEQHLGLIPPSECREFEGTFGVSANGDVKLFGTGVGIEGSAEVTVKANSLWAEQRCRLYMMAHGLLNDGDLDTGKPTSYDPKLLTNGFDGLRFAYQESGELIADRLYEIGSILKAPVQTTTNSKGKSWGGSRTTTHEQYQEETITNGEAFSTEESWGTATAQDSAHAADLWFTYKVRNAGTEYAREIADLAFNIYIGDDPNPAYTYFVAPDLSGDGKFHNFMPGEEHEYTASHIHLNLEQMKTIDLGGPVRVVVEDFTYGADELFYQDAANAGVLLAMEDGTTDGDEAIDTYLIPTWGDETVLDALARYFPHTTDENDMLVAVWTPEQRADTPAWCVEPARTGNTLWCKHALSTADWWNVYTSGMGDGTEGFQNTLAAPGQTALFRFNTDTDLDGYSDRSEEKLGTDPDDPASYPKPELLAGVHSDRDSNNVVATLSLLNTGMYDAYGVEAVMIAPDDTTSITNNTVGGSGRVRAQRQVIVGSRIAAQSPLPTAWLADDHAKPVAGGYYTGDEDRTYTLTAVCGNSLGCEINSAWTLNWSDDKGASSSLAFDDTYASPTLRSIGDLGVQLGFLSGKVFNSDSFAVIATTPRDTFQYTIAEGHESDYTPPVVVVSYNDPQGNHRFVTPISLTSPTENLATHSGEMLSDAAGVEIVTSGPFAAAQTNTTDLIVQAPPSARMLGAHIFLEFIDPDGIVVREEAVTTDLEPGPNLVPISWNPADFNPPYDPTQDYIVMAFFTDYQGNIVGTAGRPLSSFQADPRPTLAFDATATTWDFGSVAQGAMLNHTFALANTGLTNLKATVVGTGARVDKEVPGQPAWTDTGLDIAAGDALGIRASGQVCYATNGTTSCYGPDGNGAAATSGWSAPEAAQHSLIARIGSGAPFFVGATYVSTSATSGRLYLGSNDTATSYADNGGEYQAHIEIQGLPTSPGRQPSLSIDPAGTLNLNVAIDTYYLPPGTYDRSVTVRTSDPTHPSQTFRVQGTVLPYSDPARALAISPYQPWDQKVVVSGDRTARALVTFDDGILAGAASVQPLWVYDDSRQTRLGAGKEVARATASGIAGFLAATAGTPVDQKALPVAAQVEGISNGSTAFPSAVASFEDMFGDGRDGVMPSSGNLDENNGAGAGDVGIAIVNSGGAGAYSLNVTDAYAGWRINTGDVVLIHQTQGTNAGCWELNKAAADYAGGATIQVTKPLQCNYLSSGNSHAQIQRVPQYTDCPVSGSVTPVYAWNGSTGGIFAVMCSGTMSISGSISASGVGYRGGVTGSWINNTYSYSGDGTIGPSIKQRTANGNGGGGGRHKSGRSGGGGGGGHAVNGANGNPSSEGDDNGYGGNAAGVTDLTNAVLGGGGGGGGHSDENNNGGAGGAGGGLVFLFASQLQLSGTIATNGSNGANSTYQTFDDGGGGGGGAGGAILVRSATASLGVNKLTATGGYGGVSTQYGGSGGAGSVGRIRIEFCDSMSGTTNPVASAQKLTCYGTISGKVWSDNNNNGVQETNEPNLVSVTVALSGVGSTTTSSSGTYSFANVAPGSYTVSVTPPTGYVNTTPGSVVINVASNSTNTVNFGLQPRASIAGKVFHDTNNNGGQGAGEAGVAGVTVTLSTGATRTTASDGSYTFADLMPGSYSVAVSVPDGYVNTTATTVPVTLTAGQVGAAHFGILIYTIEKVSSSDHANRFFLPETFRGGRRYWVQYGRSLTYASGGSLTAQVEAPQVHYGSAEIDVFVTGPASSNIFLQIGLDIGCDSSEEWSVNGNYPVPITFGATDLAVGFNRYLATLPLDPDGSVDIPLCTRFNLAGQLYLTDLILTADGISDVSISASDIAINATDPVEGDEVAVQAVVRNASQFPSGALIASFYATSPDWGEWYIGSAFVPNVPAGGTAQAEITWNTLGFTGDVPVRVVVDPYDRVAEPDETNNEATASLTIKTRPDLRVTEIALSDDEPMAGEAVEVTLTVHNYGQTTPAGSVLALYDGNPDAEGTELITGLLAPAPGADATLTYTWTPDGTGVRRLFARADRAGNISEYDEGNNDTWRDVYIGLASPLLIDSGGGDAYDPAYTPQLGFGYLGSPLLGACDASAAGTLRSDYSGHLSYRFDHLLPGHFYHLDITLYECDGLGRQQQVRIDDNLISDVIDLSDLAVHRFSFRLDPALYADRSIVVGVEELLGNDAIVSEINLYDIDYRYADAGAAGEAAYTPARGYGYLDGVAQETWGKLPYQTRRIDLSDTDPSDNPDNELRYRFDHLSASKRYQLRFSVYQGAGTATVQQSVSVDSVDTGVVLEVVGIDQDEKIVDVPIGMYSDDGTITARVTRLGGATAGAFINEIALEELTLLPDQVTQVTQSMDVHTGGPNWFSFNVKPPVRPAVACTGVTATSAFTNLYGSVLLGAAAAPVGTIVEAYTPGGVKTGCFKVAAEGLYGYMRVYGAEGATPGMQPGDPIILKVNGITASPTPYPVIWQDDKGTREIGLVAPDVIPVETLLASINDKVTKLQCESGTYLPPPADPRFNTCTTVAPGQGYLLWTNAATTLNITGSRVATDEPVELHAGYNWLGYLPTCELAVTTALAGIEGKYDILHSETGTYKPPPANPDYNTFNTMAPGKGYMIHMTEAATLTYPAGLCGAAQNVAEATFTCPAAATSRFTHFYGHVTPVEDAPAGAVILAYSPRGEVVGCGEVREDGLYPYLRVYGAEDAQPGMREGEPVRFTVNGRITLKSTEAIWQNDWDVHPLDLTVGGIQFHLPMIWR